MNNDLVIISNLQIQHLLLWLCFLWISQLCHCWLQFLPNSQIFALQISRLWIPGKISLKAQFCECYLSYLNRPCRHCPLINLERSQSSSRTFTGQLGPGALLVLGEQKSAMFSSYNWYEAIKIMQGNSLFFLLSWMSNTNHRSTFSFKFIPALTPKEPP